MKSRLLFFLFLMLLSLSGLIMAGCQFPMLPAGTQAVTTAAGSESLGTTGSEAAASTTAASTTATVTTVTGTSAPVTTAEPEDTFIALPKTILTTKGQMLTLYFRSIVQLGEGESLLVTAEGDRGTQLADRWEYAPEKAETFSLKFELIKDGAAIKKETFTVEVKNGSTKDLNVLVLGDSTVNAGTITQTMLSLAETYNRGLTLLGTRGDNGNFHEGRGGWSAKGYWTTASTDTYVNAFYNSAVGHFDFEYYMEQNGYDSVDVVVIQLGINDIFGLTTPERVESGIAEYIEHMEKIIDNILDYRRTIKIVIHPVIPCTANEEEFRRVYPTSPQTIEGYLSNMQTVNMALIEAFGEENKIYISPYHAALDSVANQPSDVHPSYTGYTQLGRETYNFITAVTARS